VSENNNGLKKVLEELLAHRDSDGKPLTQQSMADKLNADNLPSLSGKPWSKYSVRRILKNLGLRTVTSASTASKKKPPRPKARKKATARKTTPVRSSKKKQLPDETALKASSPLMQWNYYESIRGVFEELTKEPCSSESLADQLNARKILTADGQSWDVASVSRVLKVLKPQTTAVQIDDAEIRERIKQGVYDTDTERFVALPVEKKGKKEKRAKKEKPKKKNKKKGGGKAKKSKK